MVTLELGIDAAGVATGGAQAASAMAGIGQAAALATASLAGTTGAMAGFNTVLTASMPWITAIGAALSGVATGLLLFQERTEQAASSWKKLVDGFREAQAVEQIGFMFPGAFGNASQMRINAASGAALAIQTDILSGSADPRAFREFAGAINLSPESLFDRLSALNASGDIEGGIVLPEGAAPGTAFSGRFGFDDFRVSPEAQVRLLSDYRDRLRSDYAAQNPVPGYRGPLRPGADDFSLRRELRGLPDTPDPYFGGEGSVLITEIRQRQVDQENDIKRKREASEVLREQLQLARQISDTLADGAFNWVAGLQSGQDVMASLLLQFGRAINREVFAQTGRAIVSAFNPTT